MAMVSAVPMLADIRAVQTWKLVNEHNVCMG